jgi:hypothetical protein
VFNVTTSGSDAARLARLCFLYGAPLLEGDDRLKSHKLAEAVRLGAEGLDVSWEGLRRTPRGLAADLTISGGNAAVKYNVYLRNDILLEFASTDRSRVELAAHLLRLAGVGTEVKKEGGRDVWYVRAATDVLASGREELRKALAEIVRKAVESGWVDAGKAEGWLEKLEKGRVLKEGWPRYEMGLINGALVLRYETTNSDSIEREAQRFRAMGLEEGRHFTVKMPEGGRLGYVYTFKEGLAYAAWLSVHGSGEQRRLAEDFISYIQEKAKEEGEDVRRKVLEVVEEGKARGSLALKGFEKKFEVDCKTYVVKVIGGEAVEEDRGGRKLLRIRITAEVGRVEDEHTIVDRVVRNYTITFGRYGADNATLGYATARADPDGREADAERFSAVVETLTGKRPRVYRMKNDMMIMECGREHLEGFMRYAELAEAITRWLEETSRRMPHSRAVYTGLSIGQYSESLVADGETSASAVQARPLALYQEHRPPCGTATSTRSSRPHAVRSRYKPEGDPLGDTDPNLYIVLYTGRYAHRG